MNLTIFLSIFSSRMAPFHAPLANISEDLYPTIDRYNVVGMRILCKIGPLTGLVFRYNN